MFCSNLRRRESKKRYRPTLNNGPVNMTNAANTRGLVSDFPTVGLRFKAGMWKTYNKRSDLYGNRPEQVRKTLNGKSCKQNVPGKGDKTLKYKCETNVQRSC